MAYTHTLPLYISSTLLHRACATAHSASHIEATKTGHRSRIVTSKTDQMPTDRSGRMDSHRLDPNGQTVVPDERAARRDLNGQIVKGRLGLSGRMAVAGPNGQTATRQDPNGLIATQLQLADLDPNGQIPNQEAQPTDTQSPADPNGQTATHQVPNGQTATQQPLANQDLNGQTAIFPAPNGPTPPTAPRTSKLHPQADLNGQTATLPDPNGPTPPTERKTSKPHHQANPNGQTAHPQDRSGPTRNPAQQAPSAQQQRTDPNGQTASPAQRAHSAQQQPMARSGPTARHHHRDRSGQILPRGTRTSWLLPLMDRSGPTPTPEAPITSLRHLPRRLILLPRHSPEEKRLRGCNKIPSHVTAAHGQLY